MKTQFPYFNDSDVGYVDPDFLDENERQSLLSRFKSNHSIVEEKNITKDEEESEEVPGISEGE